MNKLLNDYKTIHHSSLLFLAFIGLPVSIDEQKQKTVIKKYMPAEKSRFASVLTAGWFYPQKAVRSFVKDSHCWFS